MSSDDDTDSTELDGEYDSELDSDADMRIEDNVDAPDGVDIDGNVDLEKDGDDDEKKDEEMEDEQEVEELDEDQEEDQDEDDGKEPRTLGQGEMVNTSADDVDTRVDNQPFMLPEQRQENRKHTSWPQPQAPAPRLQTSEPRPWPRTPETHPLSGMEYLGLVTPQKSHPAEPTQPEVEVVRNTSDVDVHFGLAAADWIGRWR